MKFEYPAGATPIDPTEAAGLIPTHLTLQRELDEYEEANILAANEWLSSRRRGDPLEDSFVFRVHRRMFDRTWRWAGKARRTDKNIGVRWPEIPTRLRQLLGDARTQIEHKAYPPSEIAARYHHRLVSVHVPEHSMTVRDELGRLSSRNMTHSPVKFISRMSMRITWGMRSI